MKFSPHRKRVVLFSRLSADECARRLEQAIDTVEFSLFPFSGYRGAKPFLVSGIGRLKTDLREDTREHEAFQETFRLSLCECACGRLVALRAWLRRNRY